MLPIIALLVASCDRDDDPADHHDSTAPTAASEGHASASEGDDHAATDGHSTAGPDTPCEGVEPFMIGASAEGERIRVSVLEATPSQPFRGDNAWIVQLTDLEGMPLEGLEIEVQPWMPDHGHGTAVGAEITDRGDGELHVDPINLWMAGLWEVRFLVTTGGADDRADILVCVD